MPDDALALFREAVDRGKELTAEWHDRFEAYRAAFPAESADLQRRLAGRLPDGWDGDLPSYPEGEQVATRNASQDTIQKLAAHLPELFGGAADLSESNLTDVKANGQDHFESDHPGRNLRFGVREHGMGGIANGIAYHGGFIPYAATFLTFSDYMRGSVRLASLSGLHVLYVWTHDSIGLGEDGPTHQAVEHYAALRGDPQPVVRATRRRRRGGGGVGDGRRTGPGGSPRGPVGMAFTRQKLPTLPGTGQHARDGVRRGGYVLREAAGGTPQVILIGTGSELQLAYGAADQLEADGIPARVVSLPCWELFDLQDQDYRNSVLPPDVRKRVSVEAACLDGLGTLGRRRGRDHRAGSLRRQRAGRHDLRGVRVHDRSGRRHRPEGRPGGPPRPDPDARGGAARGRRVMASHRARCRPARRAPTARPGSDPGHD